MFASLVSIKSRSKYVSRSLRGRSSLNSLKLLAIMFDLEMMRSSNSSSEDTSSSCYVAVERCVSREGQYATSDIDSIHTESPESRYATFNSISMISSISEHGTIDSISRGSVQCESIAEKSNSYSSLIHKDKGKKCPPRNATHCVVMTLIVVCGIGSVLLINELIKKEKQTRGPIHPRLPELPGFPDDLIPGCEDLYIIRIKNSRRIQCTIRHIGVNDSLIMRKHGYNDNETMIKYGFQARRANEERAIIAFDLNNTDCTDQGNFTISTYTRESVQAIHHFYVVVEDSRDKPMLEKLPETRGYIAGESFSLECKANVACSKKELVLKRKEKGTTNFRNIEKDSVTLSFVNTSYEENEVILHFATTLTNQSDGDEFICELEGTDISSDVYQLATVPVEFCKDKAENCDYPHPTRCDMWIICESDNLPVIQKCGPSMYYSPATDCQCCAQHECVIHQLADCPFD